MNDNISTITAVSPFDSIRRTRPDGTEYWSARDLHGLMNYSSWQKFETPLRRAMATAENQGHHIDTHFNRTVKVSGSGPNAEDFHLSRFAAYLVAMNGDPKIPDVAAAQAYFAIQTRVAETAPAAPVMDLTSLAGIDAILNAGKAALNRAIEAEAIAKSASARAEKSEAIVEVIEGGKGFSIREFHKHYFSDVPERQMFDLLYAKRLLIDQRGARTNSKGKKIPGKQHMHPAAEGKPFFFLDPFIDKYTGDRHYHTKVRPGEPETNLVAKLERLGLASNKNQTNIYLKEIA